MESFLSRYRNVLVLVFVLLAQVIGLAVQVRRPGQTAGDRAGVRLIRAWVVGIVGPPERLLHATGHGIRGVWANYLDLVHVRQQNRNLQSQLDQLRLEEASLAEDARQDLRLQGLLGFQQKYIYKTVVAQVIGTAGTEQSRVLLIDKGSSDGLAPDLPVITPDGIVGKTRDVFDHTSQVLEISDPASGAGVILQQTRIQGVLRGDSWGQPEIVNISPDERIKPGEPVVTSGGDSIYPRGLAVGTVDRVVADPDGTLVNVLVKPSANLARLEEVLIITNTGDQIPAEMQQDLNDAQQRASNILAERLPSRADPNAPPPKPSAAGQNGAQPGTAAAATPDTGLPTPPPKPPPPLHADHFSSSSVPRAEEMVPGQRVANIAPQSSGDQTAAPSRGNIGNGTGHTPGATSGATPRKSAAAVHAAPEGTSDQPSSQPSATNEAAPAEKKTASGQSANPVQKPATGPGTANSPSAPAKTSPAQPSPPPATAPQSSQPSGSQTSATPQGRT
ncbi:MAG: rod shape-determining protein MreC [Acidobacteriaceae bacterium]